MSQYQVLYWQKIPTQIKVWDDFDEVKREMPTRFIERVDAAAQRQGLARMEDYLSQLNWSEIQERDGEPEDVAKQLIQEFEQAEDA